GDGEALVSGELTGDKQGVDRHDVALISDQVRQDGLELAADPQSEGGRDLRVAEGIDYHGARLADLEGLGGRKAGGSALDEDADLISLRRGEVGGGADDLRGNLTLRAGGQGDAPERCKSQQGRDEESVASRCLGQRRVSSGLCVPAPERGAA